MSEQDISEADQARYSQVMFSYDEAMRKEAERISKLKAKDHHTRCRDCGRFTSKERWVLKSSLLAIKRNHRPLCFDCHCEYDNDY